MENLTFGSAEHQALYGNVDVRNGKSVISVKGIIEDLKSGLTRLPSAKAYNSTVGCISEKYNINADDIKSLFQHPALKNKKTQVIKVINFILEDDVTDTAEEVAVDNGLEAVEEAVVETTPEANAWMSS